MLDSDEVTAEGHKIRKTKDDLTFEDVEGAPVNPDKIYFDGQGQPWILDLSGDIYTYVGSAWIKQEGNAKDLAVSYNGFKAWILNKYGQPYQIYNIIQQIQMNNASQTSYLETNSSTGLTWPASAPIKRNGNVFSSSFTTATGNTCM